MKKKIAVIITFAIAAASMIVLLTGAVGGTNSKATAVRTVTLEKGTLTQSVSATGMIYSSQSTDVYSSLNYTVKTVNVQVGDKVSEGDVLCELDMSSLEADIKQKQAAVLSSQATANQNLATAKSDLETYRRNVENGNDTNLVSTKSAVTTAEIDVQTAEIEVQASSNNLSAARRDLREARDNGDEDSVIDKLRDNVRSCETSLEKAESNLEKQKANLDKAKASYESEKVSSSDSLITYENKVKSAQTSTNFNDQYIAIEKMQTDLEKSAVLAPVSGTVTEVNVVAGGSVNGRLFVIQETDNLKIVSNIKEYDIGAVEIGDKVVIKADATGTQEFEGEISRIAPTSTLTTNGLPQSSTDSEYETEIAVSSNNKGLRVGMNTRLSIITQEKKNVYVVPYEAVGKNEAGESYILIASEQEDGSFMAEALTITTGMETDLRVEISAENLADGMLVLKNIEGIVSGTVITVEE